MENSALKILFFAKFMSILGFSGIVYLSNLDSNHSDEKVNQSTYHILSKDSINTYEGTDEYAVKFIMDNNPGMTAEEAEELLWSN